MTSPTVSSLHPPRFYQATLDALTAHLAILEDTGAILVVNWAWRQFARANGGDVAEDWIGMNYLDICDHATGADAQEAIAAAQGLREILTGSREVFTLEYPCNSPTEERWFLLRATRMIVEEVVYAVVTHENITERVIAQRVFARERDRQAV